MVIALARLLGATGYGHFITVLAVAAFFSPLAGLGLSGVLLRNGARNPSSIPRQLGAALWVWWASTGVLSTIGVVAAILVLPHAANGLAVAVLVSAEVASSSLVELLARVYQALHRTQRCGAILAGLVLARLVALGVYTLVVQPDLTGWMFAYATSSLAYTVWLLVRARREFQPACAPSESAWPLVLDGLPFAIAALALRLQSEFNKPVLAQLGFSLAGNFSAAQRAVDIASLPLQAMQEALWARLYASQDQRRRMIVTAAFLVVLALLGSVALFLLAPILPRLLGPGFEGTANLMQWFVFLPAVQLIRNFCAFRVMAVGEGKVLGYAYLAGGFSSVVMTVGLVMAFGLFGAVAAAYISEIAIIAVLFSWGNNDEIK